ncbi:hypothetical protein DWB78_17625, partial [Halopelagius longus]
MTDADTTELAPTDAAPPRSNWRPTRTSVAFVALATALVGAALTASTGLWNAVLPAVVGAGVLAAAVALAEADAYRPLTRAVAAALLLPAG